MTESISDQRYATAEIPAPAAHLSILTYTLTDDGYCKALNGRTIALVDIIEGKAREQKMITAKLLKSNAALKVLVVGHTDRVGALPFNMDQSQRRAAAVVNELVTKYQTAQSRLTPLGVAFREPGCLEHIRRGTGERSSGGVGGELS